MAKLLNHDYFGLNWHHGYLTQLLADFWNIVHLFNSQKNWCCNSPDRRRPTSKSKQRLAWPGFRQRWLKWTKHATAWRRVSPHGHLGKGRKCTTIIIWSRLSCFPNQMKLKSELKIKFDWSPSPSLFMQTTVGIFFSQFALIWHATIIELVQTCHTNV